MSMENIAKDLEARTIGLDDTFRFHCTACGKCCINREDILLNPRDLYRIAKHLNCTPLDVYQNYCESYIGSSSHFPIVRLKPKGHVKRCPFLKDKKCAVHEAKPIQEWLGGTSAEKLRQYGKARPDGKSLSRVCKLLVGQKTDFLLIADSGPGDKDAKGLIVPRFGNKPENHVAVSMTFDALSELLLMTKTHYESWLTACYLSQTHSGQQHNQLPANNQSPAANYAPSGVPEYSGMRMF